MDNIDNIMAFESGELSEEDTIKMFQEMINDGSVWGLQGFYGRTAASLIKAGLCQHAEVRHKDYYDNTIPSRNDVDVSKV